MRLKHISAILLLPALLLSCAALSSAGSPDIAERGKITGTVMDADTGRPIRLANVFLEGTMLGDAANEQGEFEIGRLMPGSYHLTATAVGYRSVTREVILGQGEHLTLEMQLEEAAIEMAPVVVTASRRSQDLLDAPVSLSVVSSREIAKHGVMTPDEVLEQVPGITVTETQVNVRGSGGFNRGAGSRLLLLVDGAPVLAGDTGDIKWDLIPPDQIQAIEILKSAASSLYGSSALGGVINMVTRRIADTPQTRFSLLAGYYDDPYYPEWKWTTDWLTYRGIDISHSRRMGSLGVLTGFGAKASDGYRRNSDFDRTSAIAKAVWSADQERSLTLLAIWALDRYGHATEWKSQEHALDIDEATWHDRVRSEKLTGYLRLRDILSPHTLLSATFNWYWTDWENDFHDVDDNARALRLGGSLQIDRIMAGLLRLTLGAEGSQTGVNSTIFADRQTADAGCFAEGEAPLGQMLTLTMGFRYDAHRLSEARGWEGLFSPRAGVVVRTSPASALRLSAGRGFRAPTIAEMFTSTTVGGFTVKPNVALSPERGNTYEIGWQGDVGSRVRIGAGLFRSEYKQLIEPGIDPADGSIRFTNVRDARISGLDLWLWAAPIRDLVALRPAYMYLDTRDKASDEPLAYRSKHTLKLTVEIVRPRYWIGLDHIYRSRVERVEVYESDERVPARVTNLRGGVALGRLRLSARISNLFQYNYTEIERSLAPIRHFTFALSGEL